MEIPVIILPLLRNFVKYTEFSEKMNDYLIYIT